MNKFRKLGFIEYNGGLSIHSSLFGVILHDRFNPKTFDPRRVCNFAQTGSYESSHRFLVRGCPPEVALMNREGILFIALCLLPHLQPVDTPSGSRRER